MLKHTPPVHSALRVYLEHTLQKIMSFVGQGHSIKSFRLLRIESLFDLCIKIFGVAGVIGLKSKDHFKEDDS